MRRVTASAELILNMELEVLVEETWDVEILGCSAWSEKDEAAYRIGANAALYLNYDILQYAQTTFHLNSSQSPVEHDRAVLCHPCCLQLQ